MLFQHINTVVRILGVQAVRVEQRVNKNHSSNNQYTSKKKKKKKKRRRKELRVLIKFFIPCYSCYVHLWDHVNLFLTWVVRATED